MEPRGPPSSSDLWAVPGEEAANFLDAFLGGHHAEACQRLVGIELELQQWTNRAATHSGQLPPRLSGYLAIHGALPYGTLLGRLTPPP